MILAALAGLVLAPRWELVVLGVAQDAGMPHLGCIKGACKEVHDGLRKPEKVACLGLIDRARRARTTSSTRPPTCRSNSTP